MSTMTVSPMGAGSSTRLVAPRAARQPDPARMTRRGRLVTFATLLLVMLVAFVVWGPSVVATSEPGTPTPVQIVVVQPGETLWDIATRADPGGNVGDLVHEIAELNALPSTGEIQIGQRIAVPIG